MATKLSPAELANFRGQLLERERQLIGALEGGRQRATAESFGRIAGEAGDAADAALADITTDTANAELERDSAELREVRAALRRLEAGTYGLCRECGEPVARERLKAIPTARYDLQHEMERERRAGSATPASL